MDLTNIIMEPSFRAWAGYWITNIALLLAIGITILVIGSAFLEKVSKDGSDAKTVKRKNNFTFAIMLIIFAIFTSLIFIFNTSYTINQSRTDSIRTAIGQAIETKYDIKLDNSQLESLIPRSFVRESLPRFYNGEIPDVVNLNDLGESWQSGKVEIGTKDGLKQVFLANDTDGKTYLWTEKANNKEKLTP